MFVSVFSLFSLWMYDISQTCFRFETEKSSLQRKVVFRLHTITDIQHIEANVDYLHEVAKCRLKAFG